MESCLRSTGKRIGQLFRLGWVAAKTVGLIVAFPILVLGAMILYAVTSRRKKDQNIEGKAAAEVAKVKAMEAENDAEGIRRDILRRVGE